MSGNLTVSRLCEFIATDVDILRQFWRIRKDSKKNIKPNDIKAFVGKLDALVEFYTRLQVLNTDPSKKQDCVQCGLRKSADKSSVKKAKCKEISCQTEEDEENPLEEQRSVVSSSQEPAQEAEQTPNLEQNEAIVPDLNTNESDMSELEGENNAQDKNPDLEPESPFLPPLELTPVPSPTMDFEEGETSVGIKVETELQSEKGPREMVVVHNETIKSEMGEEENQSVSPDSSVHVPETNLENPETVANIPESTNPASKNHRLYTAPKEPVQITLTPSLLSGRVQKRTKPAKLSNLKQKAQQKASGLAVILDRRLADRALRLNKEGINVTFNEKQLQEARHNISLQDDEENLERCRQYLIERLKGGAKKKPKKKKKHVA